MSAEIDMSNNRANIAWRGQTPWHGLGQQLQEGAGLDEWRVAAGLDWRIEKRQLFHEIYDQSGIKKDKVIDGRLALVRDDTQDCLSVMSDRYQVVQPGEILEFYRDLVETSDRFTLETAGSLFGGRKIWALARSNLELRLMGQDLIKPYLLLATSCDGSMATVGQFTSVRVVCNNTLSLSVSEGNATAIKVPHSTQFDANRIKQELGLIDESVQRFSRDAETLSQITVSDSQAVDYFAKFYAKIDPETQKLENERHFKKVLNDCMALYKQGPGANLRSANGTAWGLVNAVTRYEDHQKRTKTTDRRFESAQFGKGASVKAQAFDAALAMAA